MTMRIATNAQARQTVTDLAQRQRAIAAAREQIANGQRIHRPSDDPAAAARLVGIDAGLATLAQYERNANAADASLTLQDTVFGSVIDSLQRVRELALQANNTVQGPTERAAIAREVETRLDGLFDLANTRGADGDALFAGSRANTTPFAPGEPTHYGGDDTARQLTVGLGRQVTSANPGSDVFLRLRDGNGRFRVKGEPDNTGTGVMTPGSVDDEAAFTGAALRITFTSANRYDVIDDASGTTVTANATYRPGEAISLGGMTTTLRGAPETGDGFRLEAAGQQDVFASVSAVVRTLTDPGSGVAADARRQQSMSNVIASLDNALEHLSGERASAGARLRSIDAGRDENASVALQLEATGASMRDADMVDVITRLEQESQSLELLQKSHARFANLSILDFL